MTRKRDYPTFDEAFAESVEKLAAAFSLFDDTLTPSGAPRRSLEQDAREAVTAAEMKAEKAAASATAAKAAAALPLGLYEPSAQELAAAQESVRQARLEYQQRIGPLPPTPTDIADPAISDGEALLLAERGEAPDEKAARRAALQVCQAMLAEEKARYG